MTSQNDKDNELRRRERELQERERAIRLRELEAEINQPPLYQNQKHQPPESSRKQRFGKLVKVGKFLALVVAVVVALRIAITLAYVIMVGAIAWVAYKIFFQGDRSRR
jgi:Flp pilus assembly protein TadB